MNKVTAGAALGLVLLASPAMAQQAGGYYVGGKVLIGLSDITGLDLENDATAIALFDDKPEGVAGPSLSFGYRFKRFPVRLETEWIWRYRFDMNSLTAEATPRVFKSNVGTHSLMWNAYYDYDINPRWTAYAGGGVGVALTTTESTFGYQGMGALDENSRTEANFTWALGFGGRWKMYEHWWLDFSYRYTDLGKIDMGPHALGHVTTDSYTSHDLLIGAAYTF